MDRPRHPHRSGGGGCNVFFTLGGQRLDLSSLSKAKSNIAFRVALRAETAEDSRDVIGSDAAPASAVEGERLRTVEGRTRDLEQFRCFYVSAPFVVPRKVVDIDQPVSLSFAQPRSLTWEYQPSANPTAQPLRSPMNRSSPTNFSITQMDSKKEVARRHT